MAALTYQATLQSGNTVSVARSTADAIGSATVALIVDNTQSTLAVREAVLGALKALQTDRRSASDPADYPTTGTIVVQ